MAPGDPADPLQHNVTVTPVFGPFAGRRVDFTLQFPPDYPFRGPRIRCRQAIFHPNIDVGGGVCLNILRLEWSPVHTLEHLLVGLLNIMTEPYPEDPLNKSAADIMLQDPRRYVEIVNLTIAGGTFDGVAFSALDRA
ncbi:hypothetical protein H696_00425 [Fonticula alba]|uniref:UBC core domain-containing protein n=1 Tax=Fonticula alba TaxID=691883 RepID=A0A058ZEL6_FONAL|nr:hypothetical protein H696_00425 [Fonticula alba]KCV72850.1 hypothetical protein H696_00425 [Fonticula alba]|eukprot:XP_009492551.1 hypothetical protein H696_00425 [Fonticula alba]